jgi:hypothetical protein
VVKKSNANGVNAPVVVSVLHRRVQSRGFQEPGPSHAKPAVPLDIVLSVKELRAFDLHLVRLQTVGGILLYPYPISVIQIDQSGKRV